MNEPFSIRCATLTDAPDITACVKAAYEHYIERMAKPPGPMLEDYATVVNKHQVFVAERDNIIVGSLVLIQQQTNMLLDNVAVHPSCQGKGLGKQLIDLAEQTAAQHGYTAIELYTHETMTENLAMYLRLGYSEIERRIEKGYQRIYLRKSLTAFC